MKILLDSCVWGGVHLALIATGYDAIWAGDWDRDPGDDEILAQAVITAEIDRVRIRQSGGTGT